MELLIQVQPILALLTLALVAINSNLNSGDYIPVFYGS
jgi:hypothetical protein